ncbi:MAG: hypothetical protein K6F63_02730 [Lachnospiraceae bacterium]|nr:hypothetical protein [Lachnospiraceae bacterium]
MDKIILKRNIIENIKAWDEDITGPLFLYGLKGVGKAFICREYAKDFHESFLYYEPELSLADSVSDPADHVATHFGLSPEVLANEFLILNETEKNVAFFTKLLEKAVEGKYKWIFISDYDYTKGKTEAEIFKMQMFPLQFDEFLTNLGYNDWYVSSVSETLKRKEKLPDIVHNNLISTFEEYLWTGGMPEVIKDYIREDRLNIRSRQTDAKLLIYNSINNIKDASLRNKCDQILDTVEAQLKKSNKKFMFNQIRSGVTYQMYAEALDTLIDRGLCLRINEVSDERKFKLFYPEFSFNPMESFDEITDVEFLLREENYLLQTFAQKGIDVAFWESGNRAELPFVIRTDEGRSIPVDYHGENRKVSKSILSYQNKHDNPKAIKISDSNFVDEDSSVTIPVYSVFCIEKLLKVLV